MKDIYVVNRDIKAASSSRRIMREVVLHLEVSVLVGKRRASPDSLCRAEAISRASSNEGTRYLQDDRGKSKTWGLETFFRYY